MYRDQVERKYQFVRIIPIIMTEVLQFRVIFMTYSDLVTR